MIMYPGVKKKAKSGHILNIGNFKVSVDFVTTICIGQYVSYLDETQRA